MYTLDVASSMQKYCMIQKNRKERIQDGDIQSNSIFMPFDPNFAYFIVFSIDRSIRSSVNTTP